MKIAVSSGKGGTGKTTVATNLAVTAARAGRSVGYLDCDVEEPNGFLFLKPQIDQTRPVNVSIPKVDLDKCNSCGQCGKICQYSAIVSMNKQVLVFAELCHGCGGCWLVCDVDAADLHLVLEPKIVRRESFSGGKRAQIKSSDCTCLRQVRRDMPLRRDLLRRRRQRQGGLWDCTENKGETMKQASFE